MKKWLIFLLAVAIWAVVHEGTHALVATFYGEYEAFRVRPPVGFEVLYKTPVEERNGVHWAFIAGASNLVTMLMGYVLLSFSDGLARLRSLSWRATAFYLTLILLLADPLNLSIGPFIYGGDANGIAVGLGIKRYIIQVIFLVALLVNRELVAQRLFPMFNVHVKHVLFRPLIPLAKKADS